MVLSEEDACHRQRRKDEERKGRNGFAKEIQKMRKRILSFPGITESITPVYRPLENVPFLQGFWAAVRESTESQNG